MAMQMAMQIRERYAHMHLCALKYCCIGMFNVSLEDFFSIFIKNNIRYIEHVSYFLNIGIIQCEIIVQFSVTLDIFAVLINTSPMVCAFKFCECDWVFYIHSYL